MAFQTLLKKEEIAKYLEAGKIAAETMKKAKRLVTDGKKLLSICESLEETIRQQGAEPSFPVNISVNQIAAHYTSPASDELKIPERSIVKVDLGAHVDGYISDHAKSFLVNPTKSYRHLEETAEKALNAAIGIVKPGIRVGDIGEVIEETIREGGLVPVTDLSGHIIERWKLHTGTAIPNSKPMVSFLTPKIKEGQVLAIEPFVTTADGSENIYEESYSFIFSQKGTKASSKNAKKVLKTIEKYHRLPFAIRWLHGLLPETELFEAFKELLEHDTLIRYPMLVSKSQTLVAQAEHTVIVTKNGCEITTKH
ncbi:type II methionyl aminopeptidase [Candidatus Heimdallarchaeota archaeon]|nr:MAG: type II methionyl aminopeptidase [Candidatus Heimdallarchaeota archaeon]